MSKTSYNTTIILEATEACSPQRRGIGMQLKAWFEAAPFAEFPDVQFIIAQREQDGAEPLRIDATNVRTITKQADTLNAYVDYLYGLKPEALFFPIAIADYFRPGPARAVAIDYGLEDLYCRDCIAPRPIAEHLDVHTFALQHFGGIVTVSETSLRDLAWFLPEHKDKIAVVYPGALPFADTAQATMPAALEGARYCMIMGYEHKKNIQRIATAFNVFKQQTGSTMKLVIAGKPGYGAEEIDTHIDALLCAADILRLGYIADELKSLLLQNCHALVALPIYEGFGISALEGLQAGKIVLASNNGSVQEVVGQAGYTADPFSIDAMAEQFTRIDALAGNPKAQYIPERLAVFDQTIQARKLLRHLCMVAQP